MSEEPERKPDPPAPKSLDLFPIQIICDEPNAKVGDQAGQSFIAFCSAIPRIGEKLILEDGASWLVKDVIYKVATHQATQMVRLYPNVYAVRLLKK
jgi:hypothetical protein